MVGEERTEHCLYVCPVVCGSYKIVVNRIRCMERGIKRCRLAIVVNDKAKKEEKYNNCCQDKIGIRLVNLFSKRRNSRIVISKVIEEIR